METCTIKETADKIFSDLSITKTSVENCKNDENEKINKFLDNMIKFKNLIAERTLKLRQIEKDMMQLTWFQNYGDEDLKAVYKIVELSKDLRRSLIKKFVGYQVFKKKGIATIEINEFKSAIDDFTETYTDVHEIFFVIRKDPEFIKASENLEMFLQ